MHSNAQKISPTTYRTLFWLFLAGITAFRLLLADKFGLGVDESHYVLFSRRLAWGYFDHPPMVAFLAAGTTLAGNSVFFVRLGPIICSVLGVILMRYLALGLYRDERVAFWAAVLLNLMPYQHLLMVALLPDATLNFFWCGTLLTFWYALKNGKWPLWILAGLLFGGALLSKYHAVLLPLCLVGYLLTSSNHRFWLGRIQPYVAGLTGLAVFMPNILWNARHDWISYAYQLGRGSGDGLNFGKFAAVPRQRSARRTDQLRAQADPRAARGPHEGPPRPPRAAGDARARRRRPRRLDLEEVLLVGGMSRWPAVQEFVEQKFGKQAVEGRQSRRGRRARRRRVCRHPRRRVGRGTAPRRDATRSRHSRRR